MGFRKEGRAALPVPEKWGSPFYASPVISLLSSPLFLFSTFLPLPFLFSYLAPMTWDHGVVELEGSAGHSYPTDGVSQLAHFPHARPLLSSSPWCVRAQPQKRPTSSPLSLPRHLCLPSPFSPTKLCFLLSHRGAARTPLATRAKKAFLI